MYISLSYIYQIYLIFLRIFLIFKNFELNNMHIYTFSGKNNFLSVTRVFLPIGAGKTVNAFYIEY